MKKLGFVLALLVPFGALASGFAPLTMGDTGETCYSWEGGHKSAGSYSKCSPAVVVAKLPPPVVASPVMMPMSAPVTCAPPPKPVLRHHKPKPKPVCK